MGEIIPIPVPYTQAVLYFDGKAHLHFYARLCLLDKEVVVLYDYSDMSGLDRGRYYPLPLTPSGSLKILNGDGETRYLYYGPLFTEENC